MKVTSLDSPQSGLKKNLAPSRECGRVSVQMNNMTRMASKTGTTTTMPSSVDLAPRNRNSAETTRMKN